MATLFVIKGKDQGQRFELSGLVISIGRATSNHIQLNDTEVSRQHAEIRRESGSFVFVDLASANGSFVNGNATPEHQTLNNGDRVQLGGTMMIFTSAEESGSNVLSEVDIVSLAAGPSESRIIQTLPEEEGSRFLKSRPGESPFLARARSNLQVMYRTALAVSHTLDIDDLLTRIIDLIFEWVECDRGCIMLADPPSKELSPKASRTRRGGDSDQKILISRTILDYVLTKREGVLTSDARDDERWDPGGSIVKQGVTEAVCVPMQGRYGVVGVIYIDTFTPPGRSLQGQNKFTDEHLKLMVAIGHQAALAVEDTTYYSAMVQAERLAAVGQTIAMLSHHIKNILQGIRGGSYLIEEGLKGGDSNVVSRGWSIVDKNQEKISALVMDMLTFSKDREPEMVAANLSEVVGDVYELMSTRAKEAGVEFTFQNADIAEMYFDPEGLHRAILNVVTNAIDACQGVENGHVRISVEHRPGDEQLRVIVQDNGEGISADEFETIFTVFESSKGNRGTGLGLPVSRKILQEHGGDIEVSSTPGSGSKFELFFPAVMPESDGGANLGDTISLDP